MAKIVSLGRLKYPLALLLLLTLVSACESESREVLTAVPTLSPTPRSTPLPGVPTPIPPGQEDSPLQIFLVPADDIEEAQSVVSDIASAITEETGLVIEFQLVEQSAQAILALCNPEANGVSVAWLDGVAYSVARELGCGQPILQVERGRGAAANTGQASSIIARQSLSVDQLSDLDDRRFCRINHTDSLSWVVPSMLMNKEGFSTTSLKTVSDFADVESLVDAVVKGNCDAAGVPVDALEQLADQLGEDLDKVAVVATSPAVPYSVLVAPSSVPAAIQESLREALQKLARDRALSQKFQVLLNQSVLEVAGKDDFEDFIEFVNSSGLDLTQLGS